MSGPKSAQMVLQNPNVDTAVFEVARGGILREGLGYDRNDVAVVTNVTGDHLGLGGIDIDRPAGQRQGRDRRGGAALGHGRAERRRSRSSRGWRATAAGRVVYFSMATEKGEEGFDRVDGHVGRGGAAFCLQQTRRRRADRAAPWPAGTMPLLYTHLIPATFGGRARMNVANALAAAAAAWAAGAHLHDIRQGLRTFTTSFFQAPGRLNHARARRLRVIIDYCHNVDGMRPLAEFVGADDGRTTPPDRPRRRPRRRAAAARCRRRLDGPPVRGWRCAVAPRSCARRHRHSRRPPGRRPARVRSARGDGVRRDHRPRGQEPARPTSPARAPPTCSKGIRRARADGRGRTRRVETILDELAAVRAVLRRATPGDFVVHLRRTMPWPSIARRWRRRGGRASAGRSRTRGAERARRLSRGADSVASVRRGATTSASVLSRPLLQSRHEVPSARSPRRPAAPRAPRGGRYTSARSSWHIERRHARRSGASRRNDRVPAGELGPKRRRLDW